MKRPFSTLAEREAERKRAKPRRLTSVVLATWAGVAGVLVQGALLGLAWYGYKYTVRPVYQKELLSEQIASKELQLEKQDQRITANQRQLDALQGEVNDLTSRKEVLEAEVVNAHQIALLTRARLEETNHQLTSATYEAARSRALLDFLTNASKLCSRAVQPATSTAGIEACLLDAAKQSAVDSKLTAADWELTKRWISVLARASARSLQSVTDGALPYFREEMVARQQYIEARHMAAINASSSQQIGALDQEFSQAQACLKSRLIGDAFEEAFVAREARQSVGQLIDDIFVKVVARADPDVPFHGTPRSPFGLTVTAQ